MDNILHFILELIRITSTDLPLCIQKMLAAARESEVNGSAAQEALKTILHNVEIARTACTPICQDTGTPIFYVKYPLGYSTIELKAAIHNAVAEATEKLYLRPNAVDSFSGKNSGNNLGGAFFPLIHFEQSEEDGLIIDLLLKGGGCENVGRQFALPDSGLDAGRDLDGVRKVALDAVFQAQGRGCPPGFLAIAVGGDRGTSYEAAKRLFLGDMQDSNPDSAIAALEKRITKEANQLGIGPMGFGGKNTILGTRIIGLHRLPASFFVSVSFMCWAYRHRKMVLSDGKVEYL